MKTFLHTFTFLVENAKIFSTLCKTSRWEVWHPMSHVWVFYILSAPRPWLLNIWTSKELAVIPHFSMLSKSRKNEVVKLNITIGNFLINAISFCFKNAVSKAFCDIWNIWQFWGHDNWYPIHLHHGPSCFHLNFNILLTLATHGRRKLE